MRRAAWTILLSRTAVVVLVTGSISGCDGGDQRTPAEGRVADPNSDPDTAVVGTFRAAGPVSGEGDGRLPADGDLSAYVPASALYPGTARIDPAIENPLSGDPDAVAAGERHFAAFNCGGCHAPLGGGGMGPPLSDEAWIYGDEPAQIYLSILHGRPEGMPAWGSMLPRRTIWEMVAYIETLVDIQDPAAAKGFDSLEVRTSRQRGTPAPAEEPSPPGPDKPPPADPAAQR